MRTVFPLLFMCLFLFCGCANKYTFLYDPFYFCNRFDRERQYEQSPVIHIKLAEELQPVFGSCFKPYEVDISQMRLIESLTGWDDYLERFSSKDIRYLPYEDMDDCSYLSLACFSPNGKRYIQWHTQTEEQKRYISYIRVEGQVPYLVDPEKRMNYPLFSDNFMGQYTGIPFWKDDDTLVLIGSAWEESCYVGHLMEVFDLKTGTLDIYFRLIKDHGEEEEWWDRINNGTVVRLPDGDYIPSPPYK